MADYRGGGNEMSAQAAEAIKNIRNGDTPYQRTRELKRKLLMTGLTAGIGAIGMGMSAKHAESVENDKKRAIMGDAIAKAKASAATQTRAPKDEYQDGGSSVMVGSLAQDQNRELMDRAVANGAKTKLAHLDTNDAAELAPMGEHNYMTGPGMAKAAEEAALMGQDINVSKNGIMAGMQMPGGGLGGSLAMPQRRTRGVY